MTDKNIFWMTVFVIVLYSVVFIASIWYRKLAQTKIMEETIKMKLTSSVKEQEKSKKTISRFKTMREHASIYQALLSIFLIIYAVVIISRYV